MKMLQRLIGENIEASMVLAPNLGSIKADQSQIQQVIMNLALNARDAMPRGGKLTITTANVDLTSQSIRPYQVIPGSYVVLTVSDTGSGMSAETQSHIFEPFFTTKEMGKGTGLGLATVYGVVKQSGGYIWVYSELERGTTFKIYLPRVPDAATATSDEDKKNKKIARGSETVLVVEDAQPLRELAREILEDSGYTVLEAANAGDAEKVVERYQAPIHLLLTDVIMPGMDGRRLAEILVPRRPQMKVLYMSGYPDEAIVNHGILDAGIALLQKPFTGEALTQKVREVLDNQESK
jgi:CheY-like chemotaxis protein